MPKEAALTKRVDELKGIEKKFSFFKTTKLSFFI
jgi:hypothetical protein